MLAYLAQKRVATYLREQRNFIKVGTVGFGVAFATAALWIAGKYGGLAWWLFLIALALAAGWVWASLMWLAIKSDIERMSSGSTAQKVNEGARE
jgi:hypothetical protein